MTTAVRRAIKKIISLIQAGDCVCDEQPCWGPGAGCRRRRGEVCGTRAGIVAEIMEWAESHGENLAIERTLKKPRRDTSCGTCNHGYKQHTGGFNYVSSCRYSGCLCLSYAGKR